MVTKQLLLTDRQTRYLTDAQSSFNEASAIAHRAQAELSRIIDLVLDANGLSADTQIGNLNVDQNYLEVVVPDEVSDKMEVSK